MKKLIGLLAAVLLALSGCSGSDDEPKPGPARSSVEEQAKKQADATREAQEDLKAKLAGLVTIVIKDGKVTPQGGRVEVKAGDPVTLDITSDADEEIHVHSDPEHEYEVGPGDAVRKTFTIDTPGQVAVEAHHLDVTIVQLVVKP